MKVFGIGAGAHARYEALAGALALGEADAAERAEFVAHAVDCAQCRADWSLGSVRDLIEGASSSEVWRPSVASGVRQLLAEAGSRRGRRVVTTFGYAIAASLALNVLFVTGFAGRALDAVRQAPEFYSQTQRITLERRPQRSATASLERTQPVAADPVRGKLSAHKHITPKPPSATKSADSVPDVLAGLSIWSGDDDREIAAKFERDCVPALQDVHDPSLAEICLRNKVEARH